MKNSRKQHREEIKRMKASFNELFKEKKRKSNRNNCLKCKKDAGNNFIFVYKKNKELKGKLCIACNSSAI